MNRIKMRAWRAAMATVALAVVAAIATPASAAERAKTEIEIEKLKGKGASGTVSSRNGACESQRKVKLFLLGDYVSVKVGKDSTSSSGKWKIEADLDPGRYYAKVSKTKVGDLTCKAAESKTERLQ
jgi:predicted secreted protein